MTTVAERTTPADHVAEVAGQHIHYVEAGTGHPVVLLHDTGPGATGVTSFCRNLGPLARRFRVLAVDMPGWGESHTPEGPASYGHVAALVGLLDALGIDRAALVGNSLGAMTSIHTAVDHPDRVSHVVTLGAPAPFLPLFSPAGGPSEAMKVLLQVYRDPTPENMTRLIQSMCFDQALATDELAAARSAAALTRPEHLDNWNTQHTGQHGLPPYFRLGERVADITAPVLAIHGRDDRAMSFENSLALVTRIRNSRMVLLNRCGHWAQIDHAAEVNRLVTSFVGG